jgi:hypothetical protein
MAQVESGGEDEKGTNASVYNEPSQGCFHCVAVPHFLLVAAER